MMESRDTNGLRAVTVGTFDGLHRGHDAVLATLREASREYGLKPCVVTFNNHPLSVIAPERAPKTLMPADEKLRRLQREGVEVMMQEFTPEMMGQTALQWMRHLRDDLGVRLIVIGYDNTFGSDGRSMSSADYVRLGKEAGLQVLVAPIVEGCSSSAARRAVAEGRMEDAARILGRPFSLTGTIVDGDHIGRTLGFPTANLEIPDPDRQLLPPYGVYLTDVRLSDGRKLRGVTNIGVRPSVALNHPELRIETHILGLDENLYGKEMSIYLLSMLRPEHRFENLDALKAAIEADKRKALQSLQLLP